MPRDLARIAQVRARCRNDLFFLAREILGYRKINAATHGPVIAHLQSFEGVKGRDVPLGSVWRWIPDTPMEELPGSRRRLLLDPRSWFKTTICTIAHSIQWILNYPDVTIFLLHAADAQAEEKFTEIKKHFTDNEAFRYYFPEYCPSKSRISKWGNSLQFTVPNRTIISGTPTLTYGSIERVKAGSHYHVMKMADIVDMQNSQTAQMLAKVAHAFSMFKYLLISPGYWLDVEGTRYDWEDVYGKIIEGTTTGQEQWQIFCRSCYARKVVGGQKFIPAELLEPIELTPIGQRISLFPEEFPVEKLRAMEQDPISCLTFPAQMLNDPSGGFEQVFDVTKIQWVPVAVWRAIPLKRYVITMDTAHTAKDTSNDTVITVCQWDRMQRPVVVEVQIGKWLPDEQAHRLFQTIARWKPLESVKIEETPYVLGWRATLSRMSALLGIWPPLEFLKRDPHERKIERIKRTLQPWFANGNLRFSEGLPPEVKTRIENELRRFPKTGQDDVLDTLADQFQGRSWFGPDAQPTPEEHRDRAFENWIYGPDESAVEAGGRLC